MRKESRVALMYVVMFASALPIIALLFFVSRAGQPAGQAALLSCGLFLLSGFLWFIFIGVLVWASRTVWEGDVAGSRVRIRNTVFREQMFVDGALVAEHSGFAFFVDLRAHTPIGGAPVNLHAHIGGWVSINCTLTADGQVVPLREVDFV
jgi:hypothetical protein